MSSEAAIFYGESMVSSSCGSQAATDSVCGDPIDKVFIKLVGLDIQRSQVELGLVRLAGRVDASYDVTKVAQLLHRGWPFSHPLEASPSAAPHSLRPAYPTPRCTCLRPWVNGHVLPSGSEV